jgi:hypothetical protein
MALLGVIADALQILEDLAYIGESFTSQRFPGLPFYVGAITYDGGAPTRFYQRKRTDEDLRVLASYAVRDPVNGAAVDVTDVLGANIDAETLAAWREAEDVTVVVLREMLSDLAESWSRFGKYLHAFKHGGLVANRDDYTLFDANGQPREPGIAIWLRRRDEPSPHGTDQSDAVGGVVEDLERQASTAFEVLDLVVSSRLGLSEFAATREPGPPNQTMHIELPVRFKLGSRTIGDDATRRLEAIGVRFTEQRLGPTDE